MDFTFLADRPVAKYRRSDSHFFLLVILMWGLGIVTLYVCTPGRASYLYDDELYFVKRQLMWSIAGFAGFFATAFFPVKSIKKILPFLTIFTIILCLITHTGLLGRSGNGAARWIYIPGLDVTFQPSELMKFVEILFTANLLVKYSDEMESSQKSVIYPLLGLFVFAMVVFLQRDFSTGIFILAVGFIMLAGCGIKFRVLIPIALLMAGIGFLLIFSEKYRVKRIISFFKPDEYILSTGFQRTSSENTIIDAGLWGNGLGIGIKNLLSIPEVQTDYIFSGWTSAMGFTGVAGYFLLLGFFLWRGFSISFTCPDKFASYGAFGCTVSIFLQAVINCAVVAGVLPTTGIPLPFFSYGGSSLLMSFCMCGFIFNASHCAAENEFEVKDDIDCVIDFETLGAGVKNYE
ncbi:MAG: putative peptidoglycan glycosyltransferase FtsW [Treponema sp.]|nr:putative lipid II flippase FtsW [Spirochaetia bacterium]MDD7013522.1 putative peptidoglycan glycosyltransferase FtsW [Spirochaetales bacterium]MDY4902980.1 putative peptidoglycan glycosyltransferase FtsW [Treponema sp.]